jgi:MFS family permease
LADNPEPQGHFHAAENAVRCTFIARFTIARGGDVSVRVRRKIDTLPDYPPSSYAWYVVGVLVLATVLSYTDRQILSLLVDPIRHDLTISDTQVGLLIGTAFALVYGVAGLPFGWLADRLRRRDLIVAGISLWSLGTVCCGLSHDFPQFFAARLLVGIGEAVLTPASISMISDSFPPRKRGSATSVFLMGMAMGAGGSILFGGLILRLVDSGVLRGTFLDGQTSWRVVLLLLGILGIVPALIVSSLREPERQRSDLLPDPQLAPSQPVPVATPNECTVVPRASDWVRLAPLFLALGTTSLVDNAVLAWTPSLLVRGFGMPASQVGPLLGTLLMIGGGFGMLAGGFLSNRARLTGYRGGRITVALFSAALTAPITTLVLTGSINIVLAGVTLYVFLSCVGAAVGTLTLLDLVPNRRHGLVMAVSFFLNVALGAGVGPVAVGIAADHLRLAGSGIGFAIFLIACPGFLLVTGLFYLALRNTSRMTAGRSIPHITAA